MRRKTAFSLVEILMVVSLVMLLVGILLPNLSRIREISHRTRCSANLKGMGEAYRTYVGDPINAGAWPAVVGSIDDSPVGTNYQVDPSTGAGSTPRSVTAQMYQLVRNGSVNVKAFCCPSDDLAGAQTTADIQSTWDFLPVSAIGRHVVTYSHPAPIGGGPGLTIYLHWPEQTAIVSDTSPNVGRTTQKDTWSDTMSDTQRASIVPQTHSSGEMFNVLWADGHVSSEIRGDIGINVKNGGDIGRDCIFTGSGQAWGLASIDPNINNKLGSRTSTQCTFSAHVNDDDSFLYGPNY